MTDARKAQTVCFTMHGIGVSGGIAIGQAHLFAGMSAEANHYEITGADVQRELLVVTACDQRREGDQGAAAPVEARAGPDATPGVLGDELLELGGEAGRVGRRAVHVRVTEHLPAYDHARVVRRSGCGHLGLFHREGRGNVPWNGT